MFYVAGATEAFKRQSCEEQFLREKKQWAAGTIGRKNSDNKKTKKKEQ